MTRRKFLKSLAVIGAITVIATTIFTNRRNEDDEKVQIDGWILKRGDY